MYITLSSILFFLYPLLVNADNDWSTACRGSCSYESGDGNTTAWGSILIDGAPEAISDISTAAGWSIMDCKPNSTDLQVVRIVCHDPDAGCEHLFEGGAEETIVRLPEECANAPFARLVNVTSSDNQTLTNTVATLVAATTTRRRSTPPEVLTITIDYNFHLIPTTRGTVSMTALATTNPLQRPMTNTQALRRALGYSESGELNARSGNSASELVTREILRRDLFADFIGGNKIPNGTTFGEANSTAPSKRDLESRWLDWNQNSNHQYDVINVQQLAFPVIDAGISCPQNGDVPAFSAQMKIEADVTATATVTVGFILSGSIIPPSISKAAFTSALDGGVQASFNISAIAQGTFNTGLLPLYTSGLAGLSIPGILDVGPTFSINLQGIGTISVCTDAVVTASYQFPGVSMVYPQDEGPSTGQASQGNEQNPLTLSIGGSASLKGQVSAHLIPRVDLGVSVLSGMASASVFLELDGYGELDMGLTVEGGATTTVSAISTDHAAIASTSASTNATSTSSVPLSSSTASTESTSEVPQSTSDSSSSSDIVPTSTTEASDSAASSTTIPAANDIALPPAEDDKLATPVADYVDASEAPSSLLAAPAPTVSCPARRRRRRQEPPPPRRDLVLLHEGRDLSGTYGGCVGVNLGVKIVAGAQGKLLSFWQDTISFDLFGQEWPIFSKCFKGATKRDLSQFGHGPFIPTPRPPAARLHSKHKRQLNGLICPAITDSLSALNQIV